MLKVFSLKYLNDYFQSNLFLSVKKMYLKDLETFTVQENDKRGSRSKFEVATSIGAPSRKLKSFN
jgi:hypothetical protein